MFSTIFACLLCTAPADDLIKQLSHDDYQTRQRAEEKLIELEREALEPCRKAIKTSTDPEVRFRCKKVCLAFYNVYNSKGFLPNVPTWNVNNSENQELKSLAQELKEAVKLDKDEPFYYYYVLAYNIVTSNECYFDQLATYQVAIRLITNDLLEAGWDRKKVQNYLDRLTKATVHGYKY